VSAGTPFPDGRVMLADAEGPPLRRRRPRCLWPWHGAALLVAGGAGPFLAEAAAPTFDHYSLDGRGNNLAHDDWGARMTALVHRYGYCYADGRASPRFVVDPGNPNSTKANYLRCVSACKAYVGGASFSYDGAPPFVVDRPLSCDYGCNDLLGVSARAISNRIFTSLKRKQVINIKRVNDLHTYFGHLMSHDMHHSRDFAGDAWPVKVPKCDAWWDPHCRGDVTLGFKRMNVDPASGTTSPIEPLNYLSSWIDGNAIYGGDDSGGDPSMFNWLRNGDPKDPAFHSCKMKVIDRPDFSNTSYEFNHIPKDERGYPMFNVDKFPTLMIDGPGFATGNFRANADPGVLILMTIFTRYHNQLCDELAAAKPSLTAEEHFWEARKVVIATLQKVFYYEYVPALLGKPLPPYNGYKSDENPAFDPYHTMAVMRYGHSEVNEIFVRLDDQWRTHPAGHMTFRDAVFNPGKALETGVDSVLRGLLSQPQGRVDAYIIDYMVNGVLAGPAQRPWTVTWGGGHCLAKKDSGSTTAHGLFDLQSTNIQRGREQGLCGINTVRTKMGLPAYSNWKELVVGPGWASARPNDPGLLLAEDMRAMYGDDVDNADFWIAGLAEGKSAGDSNLGETFSRVLSDNWARVRRADRYHFENLDNGLFTKADVESLLKTSLADIIRRTTGVLDAPNRAFFVPGSQIDGQTRISAMLQLPDFMEYDHKELLSPHFRFAWSIVPGERALDIGIAAPTTGWIGVGFTNGSSHVMRNSDMILGRVHEGVGSVEDYYSIDITPPIRDVDRSPAGKESITNTRIIQENGVTTMHFRKPIDSGDSWDLPLQADNGRVRIAYAFQPQGRTTLEYHGAMRGHREIQLFEPQCPDGTYLNAIRMDCVLCPAGTFRSRDMPVGACTRCPIGTFQSAAGSSECHDCSDMAIAGTTTTYYSATSPKDCVCPAGTRLHRSHGGENSSMWCVQCQLGLYCPGGMDTPWQEADYYVEMLQETPLEVSVWDCLHKHACPRGPMGTCAEGAGGRMCTRCILPGRYWNERQEMCSTCSETQGFYIIVIAFAVLAFSMVFLYRVSMDWGDDQGLSEQLEIGVAMGMVLYLGQACSVYNDMKIPWASPLDRMVTATAIFTLDFHSTHIDCSLQLGLLQQYMLGVLTPLLVIVAYASVAILLPIFWDRRDVPLRCWNSVGLLMQTFFIGILLHGVKPFILYHHPNGLHSILSMPSLVQGEAGFVPFAVLGSFHLVVYGGGFLSYALFACWQLRTRARLGTARGIRAVLWHRFIYIRFKPSRYYWSVMQLSRNTMLAMVPVVFDDPHAQIVCLQVLMCLAICMHCYFWPYKSGIHNSADLTMMLAIVSLSTSAAFFVPMESYQVVNYVVYSVVICFVICFIIFAILVAAMIVSLTRRRLMTEEQRLKMEEQSLKKRTMFYAELQKVDQKELSVMEAEWRGVEADMLCAAPMPTLETTDLLKVEGELPPDLPNASDERLAKLEIDFIAPSEHPYMKAVQSCLKVLEERLRFRIQESVETHVSMQAWKPTKVVCVRSQLPAELSRLDRRSFSGVNWNRKEQEQISRLCVKIMEFQATFVEVFKVEKSSLRLLHVFVTRMESKFWGVYQACVKDMLRIQSGFDRAVQAARKLNTEAQDTEDNRSERYEVMDRSFSCYTNFMQAAMRTQEATFMYATALAAGSGGSVTRTSVKRLYRILEKLAMDPKVARGEEARTWDAARMMVLYDSMDSIAKGVDLIMEDNRCGRVEVVRVKERFSEPTSGGWSDILINLRFPSSCKELCKLPFELQLCHAQMLVIRKEMGGHHGYAKYRSAKEILEFLTYEPDNVAQSFGGEAGKANFIASLVGSSKSRTSQPETSNFTPVVPSSSAQQVVPALPGGLTDAD